MNYSCIFFGSNLFINFFVKNVPSRIVGLTRLCKPYSQIDCKRARKLAVWGKFGSGGSYSDL